MRYILVIFLLGWLGYSCVKKGPSDPIPQIEFKEFKLMGGVGTDSAQFTIGYFDWDGDLFADANSTTPNMVIRTFVFSLDSNRFVFDSPLPFSYIIKQPADGYYNGKSIQGDIIVPVSEFRSKATSKKIKFDIFMQDKKGNKSNVLSTPVYTFS